MYWYNIWDTKKNYTKITLENLILNKFINIFFKNRYYLTYRIFNHHTLNKFNSLYTYLLLNKTKQNFNFNNWKITKKYNLFLEYETGYKFIKNVAIIPVYCMKLYIFRFKQWIILKYSIYLPKNYKLNVKKFSFKNYWNLKKNQNQNILLHYIIFKNFNNVYKLKELTGYGVKSKKNKIKKFKYLKFCLSKKIKFPKIIYNKINLILKKSKKSKYKQKLMIKKTKLNLNQFNLVRIKYKFFKNIFFNKIFKLLKITLKKQKKINLLKLTKEVMYVKKQKQKKQKKINLNRSSRTTKNKFIFTNIYMFYKNKIFNQITFNKLNLFIYIFKYKFSKFSKRYKFVTDRFKNKKTYYKQVIKQNKIKYKKYNYLPLKC